MNKAIQMAKLRASDALKRLRVFKRNHDAVKATNKRLAKKVKGLECNIKSYKSEMKNAVERIHTLEDKLAEQNDPFDFEQGDRNVEAKRKKHRASINATPPKLMSQKQLDDARWQVSQNNPDNV